jgi:integrase
MCRSPHGGLRFGEAIALRARDIKNETITVRASVTKVAGKGFVEDTTKTHRTRWVPVPIPVGISEALAWTPGPRRLAVPRTRRRLHDQL